MSEEITVLTNKLNKHQSYRYRHIVEDETLLKSEIGLDKSAFEELYTLLNLGENCVNIKYFESKLRISESSETLTSASNNKQGPKVKVEPKDQLFLFLSWLKGGFSLRHTSWVIWYFKVNDISLYYYNGQGSYVFYARINTYMAI